MNKILLMHGPNLNFLGKRNPAQYGNLTLKQLETLVIAEAQKFSYEVITFQSNHEGSLIDTLQLESQHCVGVIINPGALSHYSYALHDALLDTQLPAVEVHLSNIKQRESWRAHSVTAPACIAAIWGKKEKGYIEAVNLLLEYIQNGH
ncbi:MAG: hypothetical protein A3F17_05920 [Gammaproteobacteria bacterium RIFCSPHIGHO2_12_FULL_41_15]|nr:MAG: hypothetical protein A3F17_05920 [Gammaproteobacteria bacterium RIFCSPHIGHO2_12_FULL_41_15]